ncbi:MAG: hypothetical protein IKM20_07240 [Erysipelotrichales bacterium]|nr:hypothetical protein [Erysipelotrichales bacterium]
MKKLEILATIVVIMGLLVYNVPITTQIDMTVDGVKRSVGDINYQEAVVVKVQGKLRRYLIKDDCFDGIISISGDDEYMYDSKKDIYGKLVLDKNTSILSMISNLEFDTYGDFICNDDFSKFVFLVLDDGSWTADDGLYIVAPATNTIDMVTTLEIIEDDLEHDWNEAFIETIYKTLD